MRRRAWDAIVIGSGISGGWAAKELCERGLRTLVLEAGRPIDPAADYVEHVSETAMGVTLRALSVFDPSHVTAEKLAAIESELGKLPR